MPPPSEHQWTSVEELQALLRHLGLHLELLQLDGGGSLGGRMLAVSVPPLRLIRLQIDRRLHGLGPKPAGILTVSLDLEPCPEVPLIRAHGQPLPAETLFGLDVNREVHIILPARVRLGMLFLPLTELRRWGERLAWPGFEGELLPSANVLEMNQANAAGLRRFLQQLFALAERDPPRLRQPTTQRLISEDLMPLLLEALVSGSGQGIRPSRAPARISLVKEVQEWMHAHPMAPISLAELCQQAHTSRRTLIQGFQDHLGMGPMAYLKLLRLHGIRRRLLLADPAELQIGALAAEWGFFNAGHFAADYRRLFGERPRETLLRMRADPQAVWTTPG